MGETSVDPATVIDTAVMTLALDDHPILREAVIDLGVDPLPVGSIAALLPRNPGPTLRQ